MWYRAKGRATAINMLFFFSYFLEIFQQKSGIVVSFFFSVWGMYYFACLTTIDLNVLAENLIAHKFSLIFVSYHQHHKQRLCPLLTRDTKKLCCSSVHTEKNMWLTHHNLLAKQVVDLLDRRSLPAPRAGCDRPWEQVETLLVIWFPFIKEKLTRAREEL
jgi:hypothetical protein